MCIPLSPFLESQDLISFAISIKPTSSTDSIERQFYRMLSLKEKSTMSALGVAGAVHAEIATYATKLSDLRVEKERVETIEQGQTFSRHFEIM